MINSSPPQSPTLGSEEERVDAIVRSGPGGAIAVAGIATAIVIALWFAFYLLVFLPRSVEHGECPSMTETDHGVGEAVAARIERRWAILSVVIVGLLVGMATFIGIHQATMPQGRVETSDPKTLHLSGEFVESNLGSTLEADGSVTVRAIGQQYSFTPQCIVVPAETPITLRATSADVVHGLLIEGTNINTMLVPGYVAELPIRFKAPGEHVMPCQEFCGIGHQGMWGKVKVVDKAAFAKLAAARRRLTCVD